MKFVIQQLGIQQEVGDGSLGLVGDVPDQGLDGILLLRQIFGRYGGCGLKGIWISLPVSDSLAFITAVISLMIYIKKVSKEHPIADKVAE